MLKGLDLTIKSGERVALVGRNRAGKSTLARLLLGLYRPTAGSIEIGGIDLRGHGAIEVAEACCSCLPGLFPFRAYCETQHWVRRPSGSTS